MHITEQVSNGVTILSINGRIDTLSGDQFQQKLLATIGDRPVRLVLDFAQVEYISSIGLRVLIVAAKRVSVVRGKMLFCGMGGLVREVFELAGLTAVAPFYPDREAALAGLASDESRINPEIARPS
jgi:anti-anti-sigma factor